MKIVKQKPENKSQHTRVNTDNRIGKKNNMKNKKELATTLRNSIKADGANVQANIMNGNKKANEKKRKPETDVLRPPKQKLKKFAGTGSMNVKGNEPKNVGQASKSLKLKDNPKNERMAVAVGQKTEKTGKVSLLNKKNMSKRSNKRKQYQIIKEQARVGDTSSLNKINEQIAEAEKRNLITKSGRRKLKRLQRLRALLLNEPKSESQSKPVLKMTEKKVKKVKEGKGKDEITSIAKQNLKAKPSKASPVKVELKKEVKTAHSMQKAKPAIVGKKEATDSKQNVNPAIVAKKEAAGSKQYAKPTVVVKKEAINSKQNTNPTIVVKKEPTGSKQNAKGQPQTIVKKEPVQQKTNTKTTQVKQEKIILKQDNFEDDESSESDYDVETTVKADKVAKGMNQYKDSDADSAEEENLFAEGSSEIEEEDNDVDKDDDSAEEEDDDSADDLNQIKKPIQIQQKAIPTKVNQVDVKQQNANPNKKVRYVVFVGNLPYDASTETIKEHFQKIGDVRHVRIPTEKNSNKPRGFAYVELFTQEQYERALSMHHTFIGGRQINVLYTQGGKKNGEQDKKEIKAKNFKLKSMRDQGMLHGSRKQPQNRSFRRNKNNSNVQRSS